MATLAVMYKTPKDAAAFDKHYSETHIPLAKKIPGLRKYEVSKGPVATPAGPSGLSLCRAFALRRCCCNSKCVCQRRGEGSSGGCCELRNGGR